MPNFKENPNAKKPSGFKMKYDNSAFPFKNDSTTVKKPVKPVVLDEKEKEVVLTEKEKEFEQFLKEFPDFMSPPPKKKKIDNDR
tara:strand:- start:339 stop:590 length:252 start_codon:yes stop_codon:yes gene_type:complete